MHLRRAGNWVNTTTPASLWYRTSIYRINALRLSAPSTPETQAPYGTAHAPPFDELDIPSLPFRAIIAFTHKPWDPVLNSQMNTKKKGLCIMFQHTQRIYDVGGGGVGEGLLKEIQKIDNSSANRLPDSSQITKRG